MHLDEWLEKTIKELKDYADEERDAPYYSEILFALQYLDMIQKGISDAWSDSK